MSLLFRATLADNKPRGGKGSITYSTVRENEVSKIFIIFLGSNGEGKISIQINF